MCIENDKNVSTSQHVNKRWKKNKWHPWQDLQVGLTWEQTKNEANDRYKQTMSCSTLLHYEIIGRDR